MNGYLLDTNVLSELGRSTQTNTISRWAERQNRARLCISDVTVGEIHKGIAKLPSSRRRDEFDTWLRRIVLEEFQGRVLPTDRRVWETWGRLSGDALRRGRPLPAIDALLAASAIEHGLVLVTRDTGPLQTTGARLFNPWRR